MFGANIVDKPVLSSDVGGVSAAEMFGTRYPMTVADLIFNQSLTHLRDARNVIALLDERVRNEGDVYAFTALIYDTEPFYFQIWRPVGTKLYQLIAYRQVIPSITKLYEEVRFAQARREPARAPGQTTFRAPPHPLPSLFPSPPYSLPRREAVPSKAGVRGFSSGKFF